ncbi:hypothetical protein DFJ77DRAFT_92266 [Powellomyces hirtus]|nr:hypothetical protein DFJ77DRAFT_92266 [Powellomyces hirtus]
MLHLRVKVLMEDNSALRYPSLVFSSSASASLVSSCHLRQTRYLSASRLLLPPSPVYTMRAASVLPRTVMERWRMYLDWRHVRHIYRLRHTRTLSRIGGRRYRLLPTDFRSRGLVTVTATAGAADELKCRNKFWGAGLSRWKELPALIRRVYEPPNRYQLR